jgi:hypothetical protein
LSCLALSAGAPISAQQIAPVAPAGELYRIGITNRAGGTVEVSPDGGASWQSLGKVTRPAGAVAVETGSLGVAPAGAVAGATPDHLLLRLPGGKGDVRSLRIAAREQSRPGVVPAASAIATDIPPRGSLFRFLAPPIGSRVVLDHGGKLEAPAPDYLPHSGDRLLILVARAPAAEAESVTIDNKAGGEVLLTTSGGATRVLGRVKQPLRGIGRYANTERAGSGAVISWSPTTVLVSTSGSARRPEANGQPAEERGGFVIQPAEPGLRGTTHPASQLLLESAAPAEPAAGAHPTISAFFGLPAPLSTGDPLDPRPTRVEVRIDGGAWEPCPDLRGTVGEEGMAQALQTALGGSRIVKTGITQLRFVFGAQTEEGFRRRLRLAITPAASAVQRGSVKITANVMGEGISFVTFLLDGYAVTIKNVPPYVWEWDTRKVANGEHLIEIRGIDAKGSVVSSVTTRVLVDN